MSQDIYLCYNKFDGLFTSKNEYNSDKIELRFRTKPNSKDAYVASISLEEEKIKINIYKKYNYLNATVDYNGNTVLDFSNDKLWVLNYSSVKLFTSEPNDLMTLYTKIVSVYHQNKNKEYPKGASEYITEVKQMLGVSFIQIRSTYNKEDFTTWEGPFIVTLHCARKTIDLIKGINECPIVNSFIILQVIDLCKILLSKIKGLSIDYNDKRAIQFADCIESICVFMSKNNASLDFFKIFQDNSVISH